MRTNRFEIFASSKYSVQPYWLPETPENNNTVHKVLSSIDHLELLEINTLALFKHHEEIDNGYIPLTKCSLELIY